MEALTVNRIINIRPKFVQKIEQEFYIKEIDIILIMPQRQTLAYFLANCTRTNFDARDTDKIVGHPDWVNKKNSELFGNGLKYKNRISPNRNSLPKHEGHNGNTIALNRQLVDKVINYTLDNEWLQIDGGEFNNKWINSQAYPDKMFNFGKITEFSSGETHYYPISDHENDPDGIAFHHTVDVGGQHCSIKTNEWINMEETRRGKREEKRQMYLDDRNINRNEYELEEKKNKLRAKNQSSL
jgi:hypothetical protein